MSRVTRARTALMVATDVGFLVYGTLTLLHVLPSAWLFKDHDNPILLSWNGSFLPLDLLISISGFLAAALRRRGARASSLSLISRVLTRCSRLMAVSFWALRGDFASIRCRFPSA